MEKTQLQLQSNRSPQAVGAFVRRSLLAATVIVAGLPLASTQAAQSEDVELAEVVVTGTMLRRTDTETTSPVTVVTAEDIEAKGLTTVQDALQNLSSNNGPALNNAFGPNGAFADGASAVSLRAMSTNSTLVLFDGMRATYYPLADDGTRNFVDLNTIPDDIVDRVEVLRDGASSLYGADAIAGVVNIITKKEFQGLSMRAERGANENGDAGNQRYSITAGKGDLDADGYNIYASAFFVESNALKNSQLGFPYNTDDLRSICYEGNCGPNTQPNGLNGAGVFTALSTATPILMVQPGDPVTRAAIANSRYQLLNPAAGCGSYASHTLTDAEYLAVTTAPRTVCQDDFTKNYDYVTPNMQRKGFSGRYTVRIGENAEAYGQLNIQEANTHYQGRLSSIRAAANTGINYPAYVTNAGPTILALPVYVCAARVNCATAADRRLNPNNPFAASNQVARMIGRLPNTKLYDEKNNRTVRFATGLSGSVSEWNYDVGLTASRTDLARIWDGYVYIQHMLDVINDGSYNWVNPSANSAELQEYLTPRSNTTATSDLVQFQFSASRSIFDLAGGPAQLGFGATVFREAVDAPSANDDYNGPTERYFVKNAFGAVGKRTVTSAFSEVALPFTSMIEANLSGRYDRYSTDADAFSPKVGLKFKPIKQIALRGAWSKGFRIPSFGEANSLPTTGYVTVTPNRTSFPTQFLSQYPNCSNASVAAFNACPAYVRTAYSYGATTLGTTGLKPEKSESVTFGVIAEPLEGLSFTVDFFQIIKKNAITSASNAAAIEAYYAGQPIPTGFNVIPAAADINNPTAQPLIGFIESGYVNANEVQAKGIDYAILFSKSLGPVKFTSAATASQIIELSTTVDGVKEQYAGTMGNYNLTAGSGTPRWHGDWSNTLDFGKFSTTLTANYFGGYNMSAADQGDVPGDCGHAVAWAPCEVPDYLTFDLTGRVNVTETVSVYANIMNIADKNPPLDPVTYGAYNYNSVQGGLGILGRNYRLGVKVNF